MNVFVTGGTGFIGSHVVKKLHERGHTLRCLVRDASKAGALRQDGASLVVGDVADSKAMRGAVDGCEWVVNLANLYEFWVPRRTAYTLVNVVGTRNVMTAALQAQVAKVVHVSTVAVWGNAPWPITEASSLGGKCATEYARTKRAGDAEAWELRETARLPLVIVYPAAVLGPGDPKASGRYVARLVRGQMPAQVLTKHPFSWVHVRDAAEGIVRALEKDGNIGEGYILSAENLTFGQINALVAEIAHIRLPRLTFPDWFTLVGASMATELANITKRPPMLDMAIDQMLLMKQGFRVDGTKAPRELGFAYTPIRTAIEETIASLKAH